MKFRITHYSGDSLGGAGRAALRLHFALRGLQSVDSRMIVPEKVSDDYRITGMNESVSGRFHSIIKSTIDAIPRRLSTPPDLMPRSAGFASRLTAKYINADVSDIAHLHWINAAFLSVEQIGRIKKPLVWTFHDMWPFCGAEHLATDSIDARWRVGYLPTDEIKGFDFDRWVWRRKLKNWKIPIQIVVPSLWLADCVNKSILMKEFPVCVIPNALDTGVYKPMERSEARRLLNLPLNKKLILFGAIKGIQLPYKGWDLLMPALRKVLDLYPEAEVVIFGQSEPVEKLNINCFVHWMGHLHDDFSLAALYSAADVLVIPSRQESFGQTGSEAQSCGCPVVGFNATGLKDVVADGETGILVTPYDPIKLALAIVFLLKNDAIRLSYGNAARIRAQNLWSMPKVANLHRNLYERILSD